MLYRKLSHGGEEISVLGLGTSSLHEAGKDAVKVVKAALEAGVNPNTVQRALTELEREGLVFSQRTAGRFVTENENMIVNAKLRIADERVSEFLRSMKTLGCGRQEIISLIEGAKEDEE